MKAKLLAVAVLLVLVAVLPAAASMGDEDERMGDMMKHGMEQGNATNATNVTHTPVGPMGPMGPASTPVQKWKEHRERIKERAEEIREKYRERAEKYREFKERYEKEREEYMKMREKARDLRGEKFEHAKRFVWAGGNMGIAYLERLRLYVETAPRISNESREEILAQIDEYTSLLEEKVNKVNESTTPEELREAVKELRDTWMEVKKGIKGIVGQIVAAKLETVIDRAELVESRLEEKIVALQQAGVDTTKLEEILSDYSEKIDLAEEKIEQAKEKFKEAGSAEDMDRLIAEGHSLLRDATRYLKEAFKDVKEFVKELMPRLREGRIFFGNETGEVWAKGDGIAEITGDAIVRVTGEGTLKVTPADAVIKVVGFGNRSDGDKVTYTGEGKAVIRGKDITVRIEGEDIVLFAKGKGSLYLEGEGYYRVKKLPGEEMTDETEFEGSLTVQFGGE